MGTGFERAAHRARRASVATYDGGNGGDGGSGSGADAGRRPAAIGGHLAAVCADGGAADGGWRAGAAPGVAPCGGLSEAIAPATRT
jgi:hypothetical protein